MRPGLSDGPTAIAAEVPWRRHISPHERFSGDLTTLRLVTMEDCSERYAAWLADPEVNRYLETRFRPQPLGAVRDFVAGLLTDPASYLFAICDRTDDRHVGNIKVGPIHPEHRHADISFFIGERDRWGRGLAADAIRSITQIGFERLGLHRLQAGAYSGNEGSRRALLKAGYQEEGRFRRQLLGPEGWEDHLWFALLREEWDEQKTKPPASPGSEPDGATTSVSSRDARSSVV